MKNFFGVIFKGQTYLNMLYILLAFPLGIFYFTFLVTGLSVGISLIIVWVGLLVLLGMLFSIWGLSFFERKLTSVLLNIKIPYKEAKLLKEKNLWKRLGKYLSDPTTWTGLIYLFLKFPLGIFSFVVFVTLTSVSLSLISIPLLYYFTQIGLIPVSFCINQSVCLISGYVSAFVFGVIGLLLLFTSLHAFNGLAHISGLMAKGMLRRK